MFVCDYRDMEHILSIGLKKDYPPETTKVNFDSEVSIVYPARNMVNGRTIR